MVRTDLCEKRLRKRLLEENVLNVDLKIEDFKSEHDGRFKLRNRNNHRSSESRHGRASGGCSKQRRTKGRSSHGDAKVGLRMQQRGRGGRSVSRDRRACDANFGDNGTQLARGKEGARKRKEGERRGDTSSLFPVRYSRGELPCTVRHCAGGLALSWTRPPSDLDYEMYLPMFMDGVRCTSYPFKFIARQGVYELVENARGKTEVIRKVLPDLIKPLRAAILTKNPDTVLSVIKILKHIITVHPSLGRHLVPHFRQLIPPVLNGFLSGRVRSFVAEYSQYRMSVEILEMLELMERHGGPDAYVNIKLMVPTYESCC